MRQCTNRNCALTYPFDNKPLHCPACDSETVPVLESSPVSEPSPETAALKHATLNEIVKELQTRTPGGVLIILRIEPETNREVRSAVFWGGGAQGVGLLWLTMQDLERDCTEAA